MENKPIEIQVNLEIDEAIEKATRLVELLREASSLASSLAGDQTFPSVDGKELFERIKSEMENEVERRDEPNRYS